MRSVFIGGILAVLLAGCADPHLDALEQTLMNAQARVDEPDALVIPELPAYRPVAYHHDARRSPFLAAEAIEPAAATSPDMSRNSRLAPDTKRPAEPLERFALQQLQLVGTLSMGKRNVALIRTPEHEVVTVHEGNYMGNNHGRITQITPQTVSVSERIFTRQDGWQKRKAALELHPDASTP